MFPHKKSIMCLCFAALLMMFAGPCFAEFRNGEQLPDLASFHLEGRLPDELKGQVILLDFWASWCGPCKASFPAMEELKNKYASQGLAIVAVSVDKTQENMQRLLKSTRVTFTVVRDARQKLVAAADIKAMPTSFLIDRSGKIRSIHVGFDPDKTPHLYVKEIEELIKEPKP